jgi:phospho-N-acetylmuramoyl-pentapeptide-transferase
MITITAVTGFVDDLGTLQHRKQTGLSWRFKVGFTTVLAIGASWVLYDQIDVQSINIPWEGGHKLGLFYLPIAVITIVATTSSVAITDGLDALAGGTTLIAFIAYGIIAFIQGQEFVATFAFIIAGANLGFLWYNAHPAMVIMGDTGALALGSSLAVVALMTGHWLLLPVIGVVFVIEAVSNVIQIGYFKLSHGKRVFKRAPYHMHLELSGWAETQVVSRAWLVGIAAAMLGVALALAVPE